LGSVIRQSRCGYPYFQARVRPQESELMGATTVLVVDDHSGFRACARHLLEGEGYRVVGEAADGASAVTCARDLRPQVALVDVYLPDIDGFEVAAQMAGLDGAPAVVLTSSHDRTELEPLVPGSGARGFVPKDQLSREAIEALL
jgi:DNA-binding NarL/FixJ family response regulator